MPLNYSKWDHIEISDDEDDTHPNIDTPSLFRWRHQARVERMAEQEREKKEFETKMKKHKQETDAARKKLAEAEANDAKDSEQMRKKLNDLELEEKRLREERSELEKKERLTPLNIDTICHEGKTKTIINKGALKPKPEDDGDVVDRLRKFVEKNESIIKKYGMFKRPDDSQSFLEQHPELVCEETANHLVIWCVDLVIEEKVSLMEHVAHQTICMQFILELAKSMKVDPRSCVRPFFRKYKENDAQYMKGFQDELDAFIKRVHLRAEARVEEAMKQYEEEERQKRLGPGGMDPVEVMESLPEELQQCFETKSTDMLKEVLLKMDPEQAQYHMKRCVDSGLWVPGAGASEEDGATAADDTAEPKEGEAEEAAAEGEEEEEEVYEEIKD